jgi:mannitol/fructose-specific phosphotransferase system IIA component (Ntr-type)
MKTRDLIVESCALIDLTARDAPEAVRELVAAFHAAGRVKDSERCLGDVLARQRQHTTAISARS